MRIVRECNAENPRTRMLSKQLHYVLHVENEAELSTLKQIWQSKDMKLTEKQKKLDKQEHVATETRPSNNAASKLLLLMQAQIDIDEENIKLCKASSIQTKNMSSSHIACPLMTRKVQ